MFKRMFGKVEQSNVESKDEQVKALMKEKLDLEKQVQMLDAKMKASEQKLNQYQQKLNECQEKFEQTQKTDEQDFVVDWAAIKPFSIERCPSDDGGFHTIIGYFDFEGKVKEWRFFCSLQTHRILAKQFQEYKSSLS